MKIRSISFKNFASYGNRWQTINFDDSQGNFFLVLGSNGAGKSTISEAIKFGLYGRLDNKKLAHIANRFNKHAHVKIELEKNAYEQITVERGAAPSFFRLYINGIEYNQAGKKNVQSYLEEEILGIPYYIFNNMISLSINDFKSFMDMSPNDKRTIIDRIFGLELIGHIRTKVKSKIREIKEQIDDITTEINVFTRTIESSTVELESLNTRIAEATEEKKMLIEEKIAKMELFVKQANEHLEKITGVENEVKKSIDGLKQDKSLNEYEKKACHTKINLLQSGKCPTCETDFDNEFHKNMLQDYLEKNEEVVSEIAEIEKSLAELNERKEKIVASRKELENKKMSAALQVKSASDEMRKIETGVISEEQTSSLRNIITNTVENKNTAVSKKDFESKRANFYNIVEEIFGDRGIKLMAIKRILPLLNSEIKKVLTTLGMDYRVHFNEEFAVDIRHLGYEISVEQLSTGERKKMDFAVLIALMRIMKMRFSGINLFFLDEIFSSIDSDSIYHVVKVLHKECKDLNLNIFVINHSPLPSELFDYKVEVEKNNGFSNLRIVKSD
jgi:DNA repair exonuclease SbcCD ATPase subunit